MRQTVGKLLSEEIAMTNWDYAQLSHLAKELGGPRALVASIRNGGIATGRWQGGIIGSVVTLVIGGVGFYLYDRHQKKLSLASESVEILEASINAYDACQTEKTPEGDKKDEPGIQDERLEAEVAKKGQQGASTNK